MRKSQFSNSKPHTNFNRNAVVYDAGIDWKALFQIDAIIISSTQRWLNLMHHTWMYGSKPCDTCMFRLLEYATPSVFTAHNLFLLRIASNDATLGYLMVIWLSLIPMLNNICFNERSFMPNTILNTKEKY